MPQLCSNMVHSYKDAISGSHTSVSGGSDLGSSTFSPNHSTRDISDTHSEDLYAEERNDEFENDMQELESESSPRSLYESTSGCSSGEDISGDSVPYHTSTGRQSEQTTHQYHANLIAWLKVNRMHKYFPVLAKYSLDTLFLLSRDQLLADHFTKGAITKYFNMLEQVKADPDVFYGAADRARRLRKVPGHLPGVHQYGNRRNNTCSQSEHQSRHREHNLYRYNSNNQSGHPNFLTGKNGEQNYSPLAIGSHVPPSPSQSNEHCLVPFNPSVHHMQMGSQPNLQSMITQQTNEKLPHLCLQRPNPLPYLFPQVPGPLTTQPNLCPCPQCQVIINPSPYHLGYQLSLPNISTLPRLPQPVSWPTENRISMPYPSNLFVAPLSQSFFPMHPWQQQLLMHVTMTTQQQQQQRMVTDSIHQLSSGVYLQPQMMPQQLAQTNALVSINQDGSHGNHNAIVCFSCGGVGHKAAQCKPPQQFGMPLQIELKTN